MEIYLNTALSGRGLILKFVVNSFDSSASQYPSTHFSFKKNRTSSQKSVNVERLLMDSSIKCRVSVWRFYRNAIIGGLSESQGSAAADAAAAAAAADNRQRQVSLVGCRRRSGGRGGVVQLTNRSTAVRHEVVADIVGRLRTRD